MAWKFYAVRRGKTAGIVKTWKECQDMICGISGAEFKGFNSEDEALEYMQTGKVKDNQTAVPKPANEDTCNVYARGAESDGRLYIGVVIEGQTKKYQFFGEAVLGNYDKMNGYGSELIATLAAVQLCRRIGFAQVNIVFAYDGVEKWADGSWAARDKLAIEYSSLMNNLRIISCMRYGFIKGSKNMRIQGVAEADKMVTRSKNMGTYFDISKVMSGNLEVKDVPLYSIS